MFYISKTLISDTDVTNPYGLTHYGQFLFWTDFVDGVIRRMNLTSKKIIDFNHENPPLFEIKMFDNSSQNGKICQLFFGHIIK